MRQENKQKIIQLFFEYPEGEFTIRKISQLTKVPRATVHKILIQLRKERIITDKNKVINSLLFKTKKINYFIENIVSLGLLEEIIEKLNPSCIILFGSIRKGDSIKESDIDIFIESVIKKELNLEKYEKKLGHKIQIFKESKITKLPDNLFNNVINGIKLYGSFKIK